MENEEEANVHILIILVSETDVRLCASIELLCVCVTGSSTCPPKAT